MCMTCEGIADTYNAALWLESESWFSPGLVSFARSHEECWCCLQCGVDVSSEDIPNLSRLLLSSDLHQCASK
jgi:hypothetical protein